MELKKMLDNRHSYRLLKPATIDESIIEYLSYAAQLAPSCFNNQPWRYVFVTDKDKLLKMKEALSEGNEWAYNGSLIIAVCSQKDDDCIVADREYYLFDTGISAGYIMLAATELELVAHPIAGYSQKKAKQILNIPAEMKLITLIIVGKHDMENAAKLSGKDKIKELTRPERKSYSEFIHLNQYEKGKEKKKEDK